jgi:NTE family protein
MRGAYEVGVLRGIVDVLGRSANAGGPFQFIGGASVGAINAAYVAASSDRRDLAIDQLVEAWCGIEMHRYLQFQLGPWLAQLFRGTQTPGSNEAYLGRSLLDPEPLDRLVTSTVDWDKLHQNIEHGHANGLLIAAMEVGSGRTTIFNEMSPGLHYASTRDPRRLAKCEPITASHILASAALPWLFPARRVGDEFYCDGGLRFNTPIAPVLRCGAERVVIVSTMRLSARARASSNIKLEYYPTAGFLLSKVLNALLLDPLEYDLQVLQRMNALIEFHSRVLTEAERDEADQLAIAARGTHYRKIDTLVFSPSRDIGALAGDYVRANLDRLATGSILRRVLKNATVPDAGTDWLSYFLFDGGFAQQLIGIGREDVHRRADDVRRFFA